MLNDFGDFTETKTSQIFFGNKNFQKNTVKTHFSSDVTNYSYVQQVHGNKIIKASADKLIEADGLWTTEKQHALCIITADCLPIMISHPDLIIALHGGWRGLAGQILLSAKSLIESHDLSMSDCEFFIGPHIGKDSFEVGPEVTEALEKTGVPATSFAQGRFIDLAAYTKAQISQLGGRADKVWCSPINSFTSTNHHSYRRDAQDAGRQVSLIFRK